MAYTYETHKELLAKQWASMRILRKRKEMEQTARMLISYKAVYQGVERDTGVPWPMVAVIDLREGGGKARTHLHNGDKLGGYTTHVPAGRPKVGHGPPFTFRESAKDALVTLQHLDRIQDWTIERMLHELEPYNGLGWLDPHATREIVEATELPPGAQGWFMADVKPVSFYAASEGLEYYNRGIPSPYIWSCTNVYDLGPMGKYTSDGHFTPGYKDSQIGVAPLLKVMSEIDTSIVLRSYKDPPIVVQGPKPKDDPAPAPRPAPKPAPQPVPPKKVGVIATIAASAAAALGGAAQWVAQNKLVTAVVALTVGVAVAAWLTRRKR